MTKPRDPEALLSAYLAVGMEVLPDRVADAVLDEIHRTRQRVVFGARRTRTTSRAAFGAAAVVAALVIGGALFVLGGGPSPAPSTDPSPSLPGIVAPSPIPSATGADPANDGSLDRHRLDGHAAHGPHRYSPPRWPGAGGWRRRRR